MKKEHLPVLKEENIVTEKKSKPGARNKKLFVNETNPLVIVPKELNEFDEAFTHLLKKAAKVIDQELDTIHRLLSKNTSDFTRSDFLYYIGQAIERIDKFPKDAKAYQLDPSKFEALDLDTSVLQVLLLIMEPINLFFSVADAYLIRSTIIWPNIIQDKATLRKLLEIVFVRIGYIQFNLSEFLRITKLGDITKTPFVDILHRLRGTERLRNYKKYISLDTKEEVEQIFDSLWAINSDIQRYAYPEASMYN